MCDIHLFHWILMATLTVGESVYVWVYVLGIAFGFLGIQS